MQAIFTYIAIGISAAIALVILTLLIDFAHAIIDLLKALTNKTTMETIILKKEYNL